jgi:hypothetical protein
MFGKGEALFPTSQKGKALPQAAIDLGYLVTRTETIPPASKRGKPKEVEVGELTEKGRQHVLDADSPKAVLEALLPAVQALTASRTPQAGTETFRPELEKATRTCVQTIEDAFAKLQKSVEAAFTKLEQAVVKALPPAPAAPALDPGPVLAALQAALSRVSAPGMPTATLAAAQPPIAVSQPAGPVAPERRPEPPPAPAQELTSEQVRTALHQAYDHLCLFVEFRDRLVEIPRLYHEAIKRLPGLSVQRFHRELEALSGERKVELHKLNEVHTAKERNLAIEKDDRLYYYVLWK